jgi:hypothetical protein
MNMKNKPWIRRLPVLVGLLVIGALFIPIVSANNLSAVGSDLPALLSGYGKLQGVEYIVTCQDNSTHSGYLNPNYVGEAVNQTINNVNYAIKEMESDNKIVVSVVVTGDYAGGRISFGLNFATGQFERLATPVPSVNPNNNNKNAISRFSQGPVQSVSRFSNIAGNRLLNTQAVASWAYTVSNTAKTNPIKDRFIIKK